MNIAPETYKINQELATNMKRVNYTIRIIGTQPFVLSILLCGLVVFVILSDSVITDSRIRFGTATKYLAWGTAFLSTFLMAYSFRPEDSATVEIQASLLEPFYRAVGEKISACNLMIVLPALVAFALIATITQQATAPRLGYGVATIIANSLFFGNIAALGASLGRRSVVGALLGLTSVVLFSLLPLPEAIHPFLQNTDSTSYSVLLITRGAYALLGVLMFGANLYILTNTDYLLVGKKPPVSLSPNKTSRNSGTKLGQIAKTRLQSVLFASGFASTGGWVYESFHWMISGWLPIMMGAITIVFGLLVFLDIDVPYHLAANFPRSIVLFSLILLPPILCDSIPADRRNRRASMALAYISPESYLMMKIVGAWVVVGGTVSLSVAPFCLVLGVYALSGSYQYLIANIVILVFAIVPLLLYVSSLSILLGSLANQRPAFAIGGLVSLAAYIAFALTTNTVFGNLIFPSGTMLIETTANWLREQVPTQAIYLNAREWIVPWYLLGLPLVSATGQIALAWQLALHFLKRKDE